MEIFDASRFTNKFSLGQAFAMCHGSEISYKDPELYVNHAKDLWGFKSVVPYDTDGTQALLCSKQGLNCLFFRGTDFQSLDDIKTDIQAYQVSPKEMTGEVHGGFYNAFRKLWWRIQGDLKCAKQNSPGSRLYIAGHSLGGALATLCAAMLAKEGQRVDGLYTFGCPRVGDSDFVQWLGGLLKGRHYRVVNNCDIVTRWPKRMMGYSHGGEFHYLSDSGQHYMDPSKWWVFADQSVARFMDIGTLGLEDIKDHKLRGSGSDLGYLDILERLEYNAKR
jgi:triacylglycerol lipase